MVPQMPADLRRKLRTAYPVFGISDLVVRWVAPIAFVLAVGVRSWLLGIGAVIAFAVAWMVRVRQFPRIVQEEADTAARRHTGDLLGPPPGPEYMRPYYETWPLLHKRYGHPMVVQPVEVWCPEHQQWESGQVEAMVSPGAFIDSVNVNVEMEYGDHTWKFGDAMSFISMGVGTFDGKTGELLEVRARQVVDKSVYDGYVHNVAVAAVLPEDNSWGLVLEHLESLGRWEGLDKMEAEMHVALPD